MQSSSEWGLAWFNSNHERDDHTPEAVYQYLASYIPASCGSWFHQSKALFFITSMLWCSHCYLEMKLHILSCGKGRSWGCLWLQQERMTGSYRGRILLDPASHVSFMSWYYSYYFAIINCNNEYKSFQQVLCVLLVNSWNWGWSWGCTHKNNNIMP